MLVLRVSLCALLLIVSGFSAPAQTPPAANSPTEQYLRVCETINRADQAFAIGNAPAALVAYREAAQGLEAFRKQFPGWNTPLVDVRVKHVGDRAKGLEQNPTATAATANPAPAPAISTQAPPLPMPRSADVTNEFRLVLQELRAAESDNALLLAKLREALASTPALLDPRELERAEQRISSLKSDNEQLRLRLEAASAPSTAASTTSGSAETKRLRREVEELNRKLKAQSEAAVQLLAEKSAELNRQADQLAQLKSQNAPNPALASLEQENAALKRQLQSATAAATSASTAAGQLTAAQQQLAKAQARVAALQKDLAERPTGPSAADLERIAAENRTLRQENESLRQRGGALEQQLAALPKSEALADLRARNEALQRDLAQANAQLAALPSRPAPAELAALRQRTEAAESAARDLHLQNAALQQSLRAAAAEPVNAARIRELEAKLRELESKLAVADRQLTNPSTPKIEKRLDALNAEVVALRSRLNVYETKAVPFTKEEMALFRRPAPTALVAQKTLPAKTSRGATAELETRGERQLAAGELPEAEASLTQVVAANEKEIRAFCNLANSQAGQGKFTEAEATLQRALAMAPNDAGCLAVLGYVRYSQGRTDEALSTLSRAASLKPKDPGIQVLLGVTLAEKGLRPQAETAFRKALQNQPNHADAHRNLAVIYITQKPPRLELARWHYQKAVSSGSPPSADFERELDAAASAPGK